MNLFGKKHHRKNKEVRELFDTVVLAAPAGSRITCDPPVLDTDEDWVIWVSGDLTTIDKDLQSKGFTLGGSIIITDDHTSAPNVFWSYVKDELNLIITTDLNFYNKFNKATKLATNLNLLKKKDRITLFRYILYEELI